LFFLAYGSGINAVTTCVTFCWIYGDKKSQQLLRSLAKFPKAQSRFRSAFAGSIISASFSCI
jgi:hypothetical protein